VFEKKFQRGIFGSKREEVTRGWLKTHEEYILTPRRQNQQVRHRYHKSPPPVPILNQLDPLYTPPQANLPKIHSDPIILSTPWSSKLSLSFWLSHRNLVHFPVLSHASHLIIFTTYYYGGNTRDHEVGEECFCGLNFCCIKSVEALLRANFISFNL
jgi:hypothetical protein